MDVKTSEASGNTEISGTNDERLSKSAAKNKRRREAKKKSHEEISTTENDT